MDRSENINELAKALAAAQGEMENASKDKTNPHFRSKYADLASVWTAIRAPLSKHGLAVVQMPIEDAAGRVSVETMLLHSSGQFIAAKYCLPPTKGDVQGFGSAITYMKRYALAGMGVAPDDDDGEQASKSDPITPYSAPPTRQNGNSTAGVNPRDAALKWQKEALDAISSMTDAKSLSAWEEKNNSAAVKLQKIDERLHRILTEKLADAYERLNPMAAQ